MLTSSKISSLLRSGWLYIWLGAVGWVIYLDTHHLLGPIESANLALWQTSEPVSRLSPLMIQVTDIKSDWPTNATALTKYKTQWQNLSSQFPNVTFVISDTYAKQTIEYIASVHPNLVVSSNQQALSTSSWQEFPGFNQFLLAETEVPRWTVSPNVYLLPNHSDSNNPSLFSMPLLLKNDGSIYPTLASYLLTLIDSHHSETVTDPHANQLTNPPATFHWGWKNHLEVGGRQYPVGYAGNIVPLLQPSVSMSYASLFNAISDTPLDKSALQFMLIAPSKSAETRFLLNGFQALANGKYLVNAHFTLLAKWVLLIGGLFFLLLPTQFSWKKQSLIFLGALTILVVAQGILIGQHLWLSIVSTIIILLLTLLFKWRLSAENSPLSQLLCTHNQLLADASMYFYEKQKSDSLIDYLSQTHPNQVLMDKIYTIAIEAEAVKNLMLARKLHEWLLHHNPKNKASLSRMQELDPEKKNMEETGALEQTLVIDSGKARATNSLMSVVEIENFGRYQVDGILGKGAMGIVYRGSDPRINREVAIKTMQLSSDLDEDALLETKERFFREAETAGKLSHANIVTIYDVGEENFDHGQSLGYIAMDFLSGEPLSERVKPERLLPPALTYQLMIQLTDALEYAHQQKVIHRDIKPANIIYDDEIQRCTLTDFGIACISDLSKTKTGMILGSPYYMSPEQVSGQKVDGRSDIFSLGVTLYQLLSGHLPFEGESIASVALTITKTKHKPVREFNKSLPSSVTRITNKALQKDPDKRYQTMLEFKQALVGALKRDFKKDPIN